MFRPLLVLTRLGGQAEGPKLVLTSFAYLRPVKPRDALLAPRHQQEIPAAMPGQS